MCQFAQFPGAFAFIAVVLTCLSLAFWAADLKLLDVDDADTKLANEDIDEDKLARESA